MSARGGPGGVGDQMHTSWRANALRPATVSVAHANYGTLGSFPLWRNRRTATIVAPPEPRLRLWNALIPSVFRFRVVDQAKLSALQSRAPGVFGQPVTFTPPRTAQLGAQLAGKTGGQQ